MSHHITRRRITGSRFVCLVCAAHSRERHCGVCGARACEPIAEITRVDAAPARRADAGG